VGSIVSNGQINTSTWIQGAIADSKPLSMFGIKVTTISVECCSACAFEPSI